MFATVSLRKPLSKANLRSRASRAACSDATAPALTVANGPATTIAGGTGHTYVTVDAAGQPTEVGVRLSAVDMVPFKPDPALSKPGALGPGIPEDQRSRQAATGRQSAH